MADGESDFSGGFADSDLPDAGEGHHFDATTPVTLPEINLFLAVVARVWDDAWLASNATLQNTDRRCEPDLVRAEARRWLLLDFGEFRADREEICTMAGLDPDAIRRAAIRRNKLAVADDQERDRQEREAIDRAMANLAERENRLMPGQINRTLKELIRREEQLAA